MFNRRYRRELPQVVRATDEALALYAHPLAIPLPPCDTPTSNMSVWNELRILNAVLRKICDDSYLASRPDVPREKYKSIRKWVDDKHENERLETVGDSILWTCLTLRMYEYEDATPMMITASLAHLLRAACATSDALPEAEERAVEQYGACTGG